MKKESVVACGLKAGSLAAGQGLGIGEPRPRLSWRTETPLRDWLQAAHEIECRRADGSLRGLTGRVESGESVHVDWPFEPLASRERVSLRVKVWGRDGTESGWSECLNLEAGLLSPKDWTARFISPARADDGTLSTRPPYLRREFNLRGGILLARLHVSALGVYEARINGQVVGDEVLEPGWTAYDRRLRYRTYDVTALLGPGPNAMGAILGEGWYSGRLGFGAGRRNVWGDRLALLAQLEVTRQDGTIETIGGGTGWKSGTGALLSSGLYDGETHDARLGQAGWDRPGFDDSAWDGVEELEVEPGRLVAACGPPVRRIEAIQPVAIWLSPSGKTLLDFGQNLVGRLAMRVEGEAGRTVEFRHAEVLEGGELCMRPLRSALATDRYTLKGGGVEEWEPRFTFHGFRYVEVTGWPGKLAAADIKAVVLHSDLERIGWFECSDPLVSRLHENALWSMRGNFLGIPTDCPQRDERLGWTGDIQVFAPTAAFLYDVGGFLKSWLADLAIEQEKAGGPVPPVVPNALGESFGAAAWADAATVLPSVLYDRYGDKGILEAQYPSMRAWVDHVAAAAGGKALWTGGFQFGDWLDPTAPADKPGQARTDKAIVANAYFARSAALVAHAAKVLGREDEAHRYSALALRVRQAFASEYITPSGRLMSDAETAYALAIVFDLLPSGAQRGRAGDRLAELVRDSFYHIRTGFVGTPIICDALCATGHVRAAYRLLLQRECPSWLFPVTMGATTIWERWDSMLPDGSVNPGEMTSFNHYALGAVADWMHRTIGGLSPLEPGYRRFRIEPHPGGGISRAQTRHRSPYGTIECSWLLEGGCFILSLSVPPNTRASVVLPGSAEPLELGSGSWEWSIPHADPKAHDRLSVDDPLGELLSDPALRDRILSTLEGLGAPPFLKAIMFAEPGMTLRDLLAMLPDPGPALKAMEALLPGSASPA